MTKNEFIQHLISLPIDVRQEICQALQDSLDFDRYTDRMIEKLSGDTANDLGGLTLMVNHGVSHEP